MTDVDIRVGAPARPISARSLAAALGQPPPTDEQVAVIEAPLEPVLVVAGAGAGKTETMASRVVWLVANGLVAPDELLGLTFTRKAAAELAVRIRRRLAGLAAGPAMQNWDPDGSIRAMLRAADPEVSTYHAYAGRLIGDYGLLLPVEPSATLLSETELWQLAFGLVAGWPGDLQTTKTPAGVTEAVLKLYGEVAEHLVDLDALADAGSTLRDLIDDLPPRKRQRADVPQTLRGIQAVIDERRELIPLVTELARTMREQNVLDFGSQMSLAARLVLTHPEVAEAERRSVRAVLLDEYQDTGHSQRMLLSHLFGTPPGTSGPGPGVAVVAVGDPIQSIYGWRGASAANLPRFTQDFRASDGSPARRLELLTSWRNARSALVLANAASEQLRARGVPVSVLRPRDDAPAGSVRLALTETVLDEREWIADGIESAYRSADAGGTRPPSAAILVRRNEDSAPLAAALESRGIPTEVVGIGGLLHVPEIADIVATLRLMADPLAGTAAMRLLTGARWQLGAADLAALWRRANDLAAIERARAGGELVDGDDLRRALDASVPTESADEAGLGDALADPGEAERYSPDGYRRIAAFGAEIDGLRRRMGQPLTELVADAEATIGVAVEAQIKARRMRGAVTGREHLDAFAGYVAQYADRSSATLPGLLAFLDAAAAIEKGLEPGRVEVAEERVQILTVHAAKGLEWDLVAIPHLCANIFPGGRSDGSWLGSARELPPELRGDLAVTAGEGFPRFDLDGFDDRKDLEERIADHKQALRDRKLEEDRRLLYVALTRTKDALLISGHQWGETGDKPRGPSPFLVELSDSIAELSQIRPESVTRVVVEQWCDAPDDGATNPLAEVVVRAAWPPDRLGDRRPSVQAGADLVLAAIEERGQPTLFDPPVSATTSDGVPDVEPVEAEVAEEIAAWRAETDALLAEYRSAQSWSLTLELPHHLSVSQLVELRTDEQAFARRLRRPVPFKPNPLARRGTAFHAWVERRFGATRLLDVDELPGSAEGPDAVDDDLAELRAKFLASPWADRTPAEVEVPFETVIGGTVVRGRIDAVFAEPDGGWLVVDWKTGAEPSAAGRQSAQVQLAAYRVAWAELAGCELSSVCAAFHYVRTGTTLEPADLPDEQQLAAMLIRDR
ncbi:ATP-dependent helicase [Williamsia sterculiae]|uniref:DNA 3'-5' helicase n=1 Tax=Williamsia sterculiae TaxID=1344003 RepID=A0A1N7FYD7_9NOCA|nr:UvrD-helicase domain-containing protein [Williamsia sterculiae]SIS05256.1 DNA helicase-2 / ATP-dependent DNA helicase PcrA [Williamsia sterculiae]